MLRSKLTHASEGSDAVGGREPADRPFSPFSPFRSRQVQIRILMAVLVVAVGIGSFGMARSTLITTASTGSPPPISATPLGALGPTFPANVNPLTGLVIADPTILARRPLAVKISNAPPLVRPQAGIGAADLVFEHITEGEQTRFTALFWTQIPPRVGSIRSARLLDLEINVMYHSLFAFSGASNGVREKIFSSAFADRAFEGVTVGAPSFYRDDAGEPPHNLFADPAELLSRSQTAEVDRLDQPITGLRFSPTPQPLGQRVGKIRVDYGPTVAEWRYDPTSARYARWSDDIPHLDANTGAQLTAANVIILRAWHQEDVTIVESEWQGVKSYSIEIQLWTLGPAIVCRDGQCVTGVWNRWDKADAITFWTEPDQQPIYLKPGNTWMQVTNLPAATVHQQTITLTE